MFVIADVEATGPTKLQSRSGTVLAHKIELRTTATQSKYLARCAGVMRYTYNMLVAKWKAGEKYDRKAFQKSCVILRQATSWMQDVSSRATYEAVDSFHRAASNFFDSCSGKRKGKRMRPPDFKKKGKSPDTVRFSHSSQFSINGRKLKVAGLREEIRMRENIRFKGQVQSLSISRSAGRWYASFLVRLEEAQPAENIQAQKPRAANAGVDFGLSVLAALSTGELVPNPKPLRKKLRLLKRRQRQVSRKFVKGQKQSRRYQIAKAQVSRIHKKVADQRTAAQHALTTGLVRRFDRIVIEDLAVGNMVKNRRLSRAISDAGWSTLRQQLVYKAKEAGVELVVADRWFASSKTCSCCGHKLEKLSLRVRTFSCPVCGFTKDRDINAAINLGNYQEPTRPIRIASRKTCALDLCKSSPQGVAGSFDGANINLQPRVSAALTCERTVVIY